MIKKGDGVLPVLHARGESALEAWENSVVELYNKGLLWHRAGEKDKGRGTLDSTMDITITEPDSDLFYHKYMTCTAEDLFDYQMELLGSKDSWVHPEAGSTKWPYHYHERLASYPGARGHVDQLDRVVQGLSIEPWKRRHTAITWSPDRDFDSTDPPCLQRLWFDIIPDEEAGDGSSRLNMNYNFRTRNVMIAAPMNMIGLQTLYSHIKKRIIEQSGMKLKTGRIVDYTDSYHVSAQDMQILENFMQRYNKSIAKAESIRDRCFNRETAFGMVDKEAVLARVIEQTQKECTEKKYASLRIEEEIEKIKGIYWEVSKINGY